MRISDWSSDVCSSDLTSRRLRPPVRNALCNHRSGAFSGNRPRHPPLEHIDDTLILTNHRDRRLASRPNVRLRIVEDVSRCAISDAIGPGWDGFGMTFVMIAHKIGRASCREGVCPYV